MSFREEYGLLRHGRNWRGRSTAPRSAEPYITEPEEREFPTGWARTPAVRVLRSGLRRTLLQPVMRTQTAPVVEGTEYLDGVRGPVVFVANHSSHLDTPLILSSMPKPYIDRVAVGAASDYFFDVRWRATLTALLFNAFPVERYGSRRLRSLAVRLVEDNWSLLLYPEGTRSQDGWMNTFKLGAAALCVSKGIPCVPIALRGSYGAMPRGRNWPKPGRPRVTIRYGRPLHPEQGEGVRDFRVRMAEAVARLAAEEELGWYASLRAAADHTLEVPTTNGASVYPGGDTIPAGTSGSVAPWRRVWASTKPLDGQRRSRVWRW